MDLTSISQLLTSVLASPSAMMIAALVLAVVLWALQQVQAVKDFVAKSPVLAHVAMLLVAVLPGLVAKLTSGASWVDVVTTAVMTFLAALGVQGVGTMLTAAKPAATVS